MPHGVIYHSKVTLNNVFFSWVHGSLKVLDRSVVVHVIILYLIFFGMIEPTLLKFPILADYRSAI